MIFLQKLLGRKNPAKGVAEEASAIEYVKWLMTYMLQASQKKVIIKQGSALPGADLMDTEKAPPCLPDVDTVMNRLKLLSGLNPIHYDAPKEGHFKVKKRNYELTLKTHFDDTIEPSVCTIERRIRPRFT